MFNFKNIKMYLAGLGLLVAIMAIGIFFMTGIAQGSNIASASNTTIVQPVEAVGPGSAAIKPTLSYSDIAKANFTEADAIQYVTTHMVDGLMSSPSVMPKVESTTFLTSKEVEDKFKTSLGLTANAPVCMVVISGNFRVSTGPVGAGSRILTKVTEVFDGRTGNSLITAETK